MMILNHIRYIFCSDKKEQYTELFQHMASLLQQPHKTLPVCIFKSKPGTGKNLMFETLLGRTILGDDYFTISEKLDLFLGRFNAALESKLFAILDETSTFIGNHEVNNLLKSFATQLFINIERKGMESYTIPSYLNKMLFTNNEAPIKIEDGDRRYNMYDVDNNIGKGQNFNEVPECVRKEYTSREDYFCELSDIIKNDKDTIKLFVDFLMSIDISNYRPSVFNSSTKDHL